MEAGKRKILELDLEISQSEAIKDYFLVSKLKKRKGKKSRFILIPHKTKQNKTKQNKLKNQQKIGNKY